MRGDGRASGWPSMRHHLFSWALSFVTCRRYFAETALLTDTAGAALLVEALGLPFDEVSIALDELDEGDAPLWALGKLHAYRAQTRPYLHIDSDIYLWAPPPRAWLEGEVCAAYPEVMPYGNGLYACSSFRDAVRAGGGWLPEELDAYVPLGGMMRAENCGVVGGRSAGFLAGYADQAIRMLAHPDNRPIWRRRGRLEGDMLIFEQHLLSACLDYHGVRPRYLFQSYGDALERADEAGFTHLIAGAKHDPVILDRLEARLAAEAPDLHARCMDVAEAAG